MRWQYMLWDRVGLNVVGWGWGKRWDMSYTAQTHIHRNHKFVRPSAISMLGDFSLSQNGQPILAQPNFHTLYKSGQCSPKHELFSDFLVSYDRWDLQPSIHMKISRKCFTFLIWQNIQMCQLFFETLCINILNCALHHHWHIITPALAELPLGAHKHYKELQALPGQPFSARRTRKNNVGSECVIIVLSDDTQWPKGANFYYKLCF